MYIYLLPYYCIRKFIRCTVFPMLLNLMQQDVSVVYVC